MRSETLSSLSFLRYSFLIFYSCYLIIGTKSDIKLPCLTYCGVSISWLDPDCYSRLIFNLVGWCHIIFSMWFVSIYALTSTVWEFLMLHIFAQTWSCQTYFFAQLMECRGISLWCFKFSFLLSLRRLSFYSYSDWPCRVSLLLNWLFKSFTPFSNWLSAFLSVIC